MGQQQLLLVILVTIIVGIATVVAINIFGTAADQANRDAIRQDLMAAGVQAQAIWARPTLMNGADRDFNNKTQPELLEMLNIPSSSYIRGTATPAATLTNENGDYSVITNTEFVLEIQAVPASGPPNMIARVERNTTTGNWEITIDGEGGEE
jgi:hypothetical protein